MMMSFIFFFGGLYLVTRSAMNDSAAKKRGDLVEAWFNQVGLPHDMMGVAEAQPSPAENREGFFSLMHAGRD